MRFPAPDAARRSHFVTLCQQMLALAVVLAVLTPAARTVTMDVRPVPTQAEESATPSTGVLRAAPVAAVPTEVVDPEVAEYALTAPAGARVAPDSLRATARPAPPPSGSGTKGSRATELLSDALPVHGYGAIGVTWASGVEVEHDAIGMQARTRTDGGRWTGWTPIEYHDEHGPDPDSAEAQGVRPGSEPLLVGEVDQVQVKIATAAAAPADMKLAVIDPGEAAHTARQVAAIDTTGMTGQGTATVAASYRSWVDGTAATGTDTLSLAAGVTTDKPQIFSRAQWGADERMRDAPSLRYNEIHAGFVHHTVNANDYSRAQVPAILRGIYAYHTRSRGWSDVGYNFLVDRFGRIWEGRYGGVDRPVVGAHTLGYNDDAFAMSAIGNFEVAKPSKKMVRAYGRLFAWKLSLHGIAAGSMKQWVASRNFPAINGHRDADSTACPGKYLYAKLSTIRSRAKNLQAAWTGRDLESDLTGGPVPDLVVRRASDGRGLVLPLERDKSGRISMGKPIDAGIDLSAARLLLRAGDWDRDGHVDLLVQRKKVTRYLWLYRGKGDGTFEQGVRLTNGMKGVTMLAAVGDVTGDGWPDLMGKPANQSGMYIYPGRGAEGIGRGYLAYSSVPNGTHIAIGRWDADGAPDSLVRQGRSLTLWRSNGPGGWMGGRKLDAKVGGYDRIVGVASVNGDWHSDLITRSRASKQLWLVPTTARAGLGKRTALGDGGAYDLIG